MMSYRSDLAQQINEVSVIKGNFTLRSGTTTDTYFDKYLFESDPILLRSIAEEMAKHLKPETEILAGLEMGGIPVVTALSQVTGLPAAYIRKKAKEYGTCKYTEGPDLNGKNVTIIEDVVSSGGAILDALTKLRKDQIEPIGVVCVIDRQTGASENINAAGMKFASVFKMDEIINIS